MKIQVISYNKCAKYSIIEFSRGIFSKDKDKRNKAYIPYIKMIDKALKNDDYVITFVDAPYFKRVKRNEKRAKSGGHKVEDDTFNTIYRYSCFPKSKGIIRLTSNCKINKIIHKIGVKNGFKRSTKSNMGK